MQGYIYDVLFGPIFLFANNNSLQSRGQRSGKSNEVEHQELFAPVTEPIAKLLCAEVVEIASHADAHLLGELAGRTGFPSKVCQGSEKHLAKPHLNCLDTVGVCKMGNSSSKMNSWLWIRLM